MTGRIDSPLKHLLKRDKVVKLYLPKLSGRRNNSLSSRRDYVLDKSLELGSNDSGTEK